MAQMFLVVDENVAHAVVDFLRERGHKVELVKDWIGEGTPDRDFKQIIARAPDGSKNSFLKKVGRISLQCKEVRAAGRIEQVIDLIEFEFGRAQKRRDQRVIITISETSITITR